MQISAYIESTTIITTFRVHDALESDETMNLHSVDKCENANRLHFAGSPPCPDAAAQQQDDRCAHHQQPARRDHGHEPRGVCEAHCAGAESRQSLEKQLIRVKRID